MANELTLQERIRAGIDKIAQTTLRAMEKSAEPTNQVLTQRKINENSINPRQSFENFQVPDIPEDELLIQTEKLATQMLTGEVPEDVQREVERITAELSAQGGVGPSQFASNVTAEALGLTSLDIQKSGADLAVATSQGKTARDALGVNAQLQTNAQNLQGFLGEEQLNLQFATLNEQAFEWDQKFDLGLKEIDVNLRALDLKGLELIGNQMLGLNNIMSGLLIADSQAEIPGLQGTIDQMQTGSLDFQSFINEYLFSDFDIR